MSKRFVLGVSGGSGSGKTSFINELKNNFDKSEISVVSQDDYYLPIDLQKSDHNGIVNFDLPTALDLEAFINDIKCLIKGDPVEVSQYTFNNPMAEEATLQIHSAPIIIIEGIFIFSVPEIWDLLDLSIFINTSESLKLNRRLKRDAAERGYNEEDVIYRYVNHVKPMYDKHLKPYKKKVDIVINNDTSYKRSLKVIERYLDSIL